jgi:hypothetical protein
MALEVTPSGVGARQLQQTITDALGMAADAVRSARPRYGAARIDGPLDPSWTGIFFSARRSIGSAAGWVDTASRAAQSAVNELHVKLLPDSQAARLQQVAAELRTESQVSYTDHKPSQRVLKGWLDAIIEAKDSAGDRPIAADAPIAPTDPGPDGTARSLEDAMNGESSSTTTLGQIADGAPASAPTTSAPAVTVSAPAAGASAGAVASAEA